MPKIERHEQLTLLYPSIKESIAWNHDEIEKPEVITNSFEPKFFDRNILCCPYCGTKDLRKVGTGNDKKHQRYYCKLCHVNFRDPKTRKTIPRTRRTLGKKINKYFDPNILCCPQCGTKDVSVSRLGNKNKKKYYKCNLNNCGREFIYPRIRDLSRMVIESEREKAEDKFIKPIYFNPNILCCPYCGTKDLKKNGYDRKKQMYYCNPCDLSFIDPKTRINPPHPRRKVGKKYNPNKYFDPNILCCPDCGNTNVSKRRKTKNGKIRYKCSNLECQRKFVDPAVRVNKTSIASDIKCKFCDGNDCIKQGTDRGRNKPIYKCNDCGRKFVLGATKEYSPRLTISDDVWDANDLSVDTVGKSTSKLNFKSIHQLWLKEPSKKFIKYWSVKNGYSSLTSHLTSIKGFSNFLIEFYPEINCMDDIDRSLMLNYISYLSSVYERNNTISRYLRGLNKFLSIGNANGWFQSNAYLIIEEDYPQDDRKIKPRYISKTVLEQLLEHKYLLPKTYEIMVCLFLETGFRFLTLAKISLDCLEKDSNGKWWIYRDRVKIPEGFKSPISDELAEKIKEQQRFIKQHHCNNRYLFAPREIGEQGEQFTPRKNKIVPLSSYIYHLNEIVRKCNIKDDNGKEWRFTSHQFRHTFGTEAINNGVPYHIVQKLLGHKSPEMTMRYAHIHDQTVLKELEKFHLNRTIDVTGQIVELELEGDSESLEWFTKEINAIALPNGYCGRPRREGNCEIAGDVGCYICPFFRTNKTFLAVHKDQLERINEVIAKAHKYKWELPIKKNEPIKKNLELIIYTLEKISDE